MIFLLFWPMFREFRDFAVQNGIHAGGPMFSDFVSKIKTHPVGWHIPIFLWVPPHILEKSVLRTDYLKKQF